MKCNYNFSIYFHVDIFFFPLSEVLLHAGREKELWFKALPHQLYFSHMETMSLFYFQSVVLCFWPGLQLLTFSE